MLVRVDVEFRGYLLGSITIRCTRKHVNQTKIGVKGSVAQLIQHITLHKVVPKADDERFGGNAEAARKHWLQVGAGGWAMIHIIY